MDKLTIPHSSPTLARAASASRRLPGILPLVLVSVVLGLAYVRTLAPGVSWANDGADSGDLITAAATLGVAHPTGYPTYLILARLFQLIPLGDLAFRATLLSAVAGVLATLVVYSMVSALLGERAWRTVVAAGTAALALGLSPVFWSQAVVAEVYTLNALFVALILLFTLWSIQQTAAPAWHTRVQGLVVGLALGNHITAGLAVAIWFGALAWAPASDRIRLAFGRVLWVAIGLLVYLYLPLRAAAHPPVNWGDPRDWFGFWWVVSGQPYRGLAFGLPTDLLPRRVAAWAALLTRQFGWLGLGLGFFGLVYGAPNMRRFVWLSIAVAAVASIFAVTYNTDDSYAYLIPTYLIFAAWIGLSVDLAFAALTRLHPFAAPVATVGLAILLTWRAMSIVPQVDASQDRRAIDYATSVLASAPRNAIVVTDSDLDTFPVWYYHYGLGERPDLVVIVDPLLEFDWYRRNLRGIYPDLQIPQMVESSWLDAIMAANHQHPTLCRTQIAQARVLACTQIIQ